jgi:hypothetical protein
MRQLRHQLALAGVLADHLLAVQLGPAIQAGRPDRTVFADAGCGRIHVQRAEENDFLQPRQVKCQQFGSEADIPVTAGQIIGAGPAFRRKRARMQQQLGFGGQRPAGRIDAELAVVDDAAAAPRRFRAEHDDLLFAPGGAGGIEQTAADKTEVPVSNTLGCFMAYTSRE